MVPKAIKASTSENSERRGNIDMNEIIDAYSDELLRFIEQKRLLEIYIMPLISNDKTVRNKKMKLLKSFNSQTLAMQAKKGEQLASMMLSIKNALVILAVI